MENSRNLCQQQGTLPCVPPAGNWGSGMHKHPGMVGWGCVTGDLVTLRYCHSPPRLPEIPMSSSQLTKIPSQKKIPLATGREGFPCSDTVRMIPKMTWMIPVKMWMVWGRMRERDPDPTPIPHHSAGKGLGEAPVPVSSTQPGRTSSRTIPADPQSLLEGRVSPPTPWDVPSGSLVFGMLSWQVQVPGSLQPAGPPGDLWPGSPR